MGSAGAAGAATTATHPGTTHTRPGGAVGGFQPGGLLRGHGATAARTGAAKNGTTSTNWSGYAVTGGSGAFNSVSSSWTEPTANCSGGTQYAAFWVGLDGYNSSSVEQTGTDSDCSGGSPDYYCWYEMYPAAPVYFTNPVSPGDSMSASVTVSGTSYTLTLTDNTQGWTQTEHETGSFSNSSAEVITEAPSSETGPLPLADFGTINYSGASANGASMGSQNPTSITMVGSSGDQLDSTSGIDGSGGFSNTWQASS
ncbi:MAG TPA: G1 family glutamic endopeptidase [Streptosporangiaceae bacterium]